MGCATGLVKGIMFVFNFLFVVAGLGLIAIGALIYLEINAYESIVTPVFQIAPTLALILGIIVFLIAFFGCCGVIKESHCMLVTYAIILLTLFVLQLAVGVYAYMQVDQADGDVKPFIKKTMDEAFVNYNSNKETREAFNFVQQEFKCCGVSSPLDYVQTWHNSSVPASCCINFDGSPCQMLTALVGSSYYTDGCANKVSQIITSKIQNVFYVCVGVAAVEVIGAIFAFCLASSVKNESRRRYP